jgi:membrane protein
MLPSAREQWEKDQLRPGSHWRFMMRVLRAAKVHRTNGHAAEMAFFAVLTLVPSTIAVGSAIGLSKELLGGSVAREAENAFVDAVSTLMGPELADTVIAPFVHAQLQQANGGVALGGLLLAWWLSSHLFESTGHALDAIYEVEDSRTTLAERMLALAFALVSVVLVAATVEMMILGPLGDPESGLSKWMGLSEVYSFVWSVVRWPLLLALVVAFLGCLYRFTPNVRHGWRENLPGAIVGATLWILAAAVFRLAAPLTVRPTITTEDPTVVIISQSVNAVVATVLWAYLASAAILLGGEVNALRRQRREARAAEPRVHTWAGRELVDVEGWPIGTIDHLVMDRDAGTTRWMAVTTGKFGTRLSLCPIPGAWEGPEGGIRVPYVKDQVVAAPRAEAHGAPTPAEIRRLVKHYAGGRVERGVRRPQTSEHAAVADAADGRTARRTPAYGGAVGPDTDNWCAPVRRNGRAPVPGAAGSPAPAGANAHAAAAPAVNGRPGAPDAAGAPTAPPAAPPRG